MDQRIEMRRYFVAIEGEMVLLDDDLQPEDFDAAGYETGETNAVDGDGVPWSDEAKREAAEYAAQRLLGHTGFECHDAQFLAEDER